MSSPKQSSPLLRTGNQPESKYVDLAVEMQHRADTIGEKEEIDATYFIHQIGHHIRGPYTVNELLGKCVRNEIHLKSEKTLFCPTSFTNTYYNNKNAKIWNTLQQLKDAGSHDKLYCNLFPFQQMDRIIHNPPAPNTSTLDKKPIGLSLHQTIRIINIVLSKILFTFISVHFFIPLVLCATIYCVLYIFCCAKKKLSLFSPYSLVLFIGETLIFKDISTNIDTAQMSLKDLASMDMSNIGNRIKDTHYVSVFVGFTFTPILVTALLKTYMHSWDYIWAVWMITYMVWCGFFIIDYFCIGFNLWYKNVTKLIIGTHVTNVHKQDLVLILCALAAILPAVIIGVLADYIYDEKLTLDCTDDIISEVCIGEKCCHVVSSHDANIGNIIALFGLLRLLSWIVMKSNTTIYSVATENL